MLSGGYASTHTEPAWSDVTQASMKRTPATPSCTLAAGGLYVASSSETHPSRKRRKPLPSRLGLATQWPQGEA